MKYLDEDISLTVGGWGSVPRAATYGYYVETQTPINDNDEWITVFVGNTFLSTTQSSKSININDIVENYKWVAPDLTTAYGSGITGLINTWRIRIVINNITYTSDTEDVAAIYRYPFIKNDMYLDIPNLSFIYPLNLLQGFDVSDATLQLYPKIPYGVGENYAFRFVYTHDPTDTYESYGLYIGRQKITELTEFNNTYKVAQYVLDSEILFSFNKDLIREKDTYYVAGIKKSGNTTQVDALFDIAETDLCPAPYYLLWQDRYGGMQSQPFEKTLTYSENVEHTSLVDSRNRTYYINSKISPKWRINSSWINQKYYPYYESIYCSPYVKLYITETDQLIDVLVDNTEYVEKTFANQSKTLFNLTLDLSATETQNILH